MSCTLACLTARAARNLPRCFWTGPCRVSNSSDRTPRLRLRRLALCAVVGCVIGAACGIALLLGDSARTIATHLLTLGAGGALVAGLARYWPGPTAASQLARGAGSGPATRSLQQRSSEATSNVERQTSDSEAALARIELASEFAGVGIWDWDLGTDRLSINGHTATVLGFPVGEQLVSPQQFVQGVVHGEDLPGLEQALEHALRAEPALQHSFRLLHADGSIHHCQLRARIFREHATAVRLLAVIVDTTQLVQATAVLASKVAQERVLVDR
jgi:PAS domain-containing protein